MDNNEIKDKITEGIDKFNQNENVKMAKQELKKGSEALMNFFSSKTKEIVPTEQPEVYEGEVIETGTEENEIATESGAAGAVSFIKDGASKATKAVSDQLGKAWTAVDGGMIKRKLLKEISSYSFEELNSALKASNDINDKELILNIIMRKKQMLVYQSLGHDSNLLEAAYNSIRAERDELVAKLSE